MEVVDSTDIVPKLIAFLKDKSSAIGDRISFKEFPEGTGLPAAVVNCWGGSSQMRIMLLVRAQDPKVAFDAWQLLDIALNHEAPEVTGISTGYCEREDGSPIRDVDTDSGLPEILSYYVIDL